MWIEAGGRGGGGGNDGDGWWRGEKKTLKISDSGKSISLKIYFQNHNIIRN